MKIVDLWNAETVTAFAASGHLCVAVFPFMVVIIIFLKGTYSPSLTFGLP
jgi:hypothetical protein